MAGLGPAIPVRRAQPFAPGSPGQAPAMTMEWARQEARPSPAGPHGSLDRLHARPVLDLAADVRPDPLLGEVQEAGGGQMVQDDAEAHAFAGLEMRLRRPGEESGDVTGVLRDGLRHDRLAVRTLGVIDAVVAQGGRHGDDVAGVVLVVEAARRHLNALRRVLVAIEERDEVVGAVLGVLPQRVPDEPWEAALEGARLRHQRQVGRRLAAVRRSGRLLVREVPREAVGRPPGALEHLAGIVRPVLDLVLGGERLHLTLRELGASGLRQVAEGDALDAVAGLADLAVDLEAALELRPIEGAERALEAPFELRRHRRLAGGVRRGREAERRGDKEG